MRKQRPHATSLLVAFVMTMDNYVEDANDNQINDDKNDVNDVDKDNYQFCIFLDLKWFGRSITMVQIINVFK